MTGRHTGDLPLAPELAAYNDDHAGTLTPLKGRHHKAGAVHVIRAYRAGWKAYRRGLAHHAQPTTEPEENQ